MMKLLYYEIKKLCGIRYLWVMLAVMAVACLGLYYYLYIGDVDFSNPIYDRERNEIIDTFLQRWERSPEEIEPILSEFLSYVEDAERVEAEIKAGLTDEELVGFIVTDEMLAEHGVTYENKLGYRRSDGTPVDDAILFEHLLYSEQVSDGIISRIDEIIRVTEGAMKRYELIDATDLPVYEYERHYNERYTAVRNGVSLSASHPYGWNMISRYEEFGIFVYAYLLLAAGVIFLNERSVGLLPVIRTTRGGRIRTSAAKLGALAVMSVFTVLVFTFGVLAVTHFTFGLSRADVAVQNVFYESPYLMTVGEYFLCLTLVRCLCAVAFSCVVAFVSALSFSSVITYISGAVLLIANVFANYALGGADAAPFNLVAIWKGSLFLRYGESLLFGHYVSTLSACVVILSVTAIGAGAAVVVVGGRRSFVPSPKRVQFILTALQARAEGVAERLRARSQQRYPSSLFRWECEKLMTPGVSALLVILLIASGYASFSSYGKSIPRSWREYEAYVSENFMGELDDEKREYIKMLCEEKRFIASDESREYMTDAYRRGEITWDEYVAFLDSRDSASAELTMLTVVSERVGYLDAAEDETGIRGWLMPDAMLSRILGRDINVFLLFAVVIVFSRMYTADYAKKSSEGEFSSILRTTARGRRKQFRAKFASAAVISVILAAFFEITDLAVGITSTEYFFDVLAAPVSSIEQYRLLGGMTVGEYVALTELLRLFSYVILAMLICVASYMAKKLPPTLFIVAAFTLLPYVLVYMGQLMLRYVDFTAMLAGGKLLLRSAEFAVAGGTYTFAEIFLLAASILTALSTLCVRCRTGK